MRAMFHDFPNDSTCWDIDDQYMLGPDLLVAPVLHPGQRQRRVYLPHGASWTDLASGTVHQGGAEIVMEAPLEAIPVLARNGSRPELLGPIT